MSGYFYSVLRVPSTINTHLFEVTAPSYHDQDPIRDNVPRGADILVNGYTPFSAN